jgi:hypothetical protein
MARQRNIAPGFFRNEDLGECSPLARLLFAGLWCWADRLGRVEDRPKRLRAEILPYDSADGEALVAELTEHGFLRRYEAAGARVLQIVNFNRYQKPHPRESPSTLPDENGLTEDPTQGAPKVDPGLAEGAPQETPSPAHSLTLSLSHSLEAAAAAREEAKPEPTPPVEAKPDPIRSRPIHFQMSCPTVAALLQRAAFGVEIGDKATQWGAADNLATQLGADRALALAVEAAPRSRGYPHAVPLTFLSRVWLDAVKGAPAPARPRNPLAAQPAAKDFTGGF